MFLEFDSRIRPITPKRSVARVLLDSLRVQIRRLVEVVCCTPQSATDHAPQRSNPAYKVPIYTRYPHTPKSTTSFSPYPDNTEQISYAHINALLASALNDVASAFASSVMSCRLSFDSAGDGAREVVGVLAWDLTSLLAESLDMLDVFDSRRVCSRKRRLSD